MVLNWCNLMLLMISFGLTTTVWIPVDENLTGIKQIQYKNLKRTLRQATDEDVVFFDNEELPENTISQLYSEEEKNCLANRKFLVNGKCYSFATIGPCQKDEWLVLDDNEDYAQVNTPLKPICKKKLCKDRTEIWWPSLEKCVKKSWAKMTYCNETNKEIIINPYGEAQCSCINTHGILENGNKCYEYYQQGPCKSSEVVTYDVTKGFAVCTMDICLRENYKPRAIKRDIHHIAKYKEIDIESYSVNKRFERATAVSRRKIYAPLEGNGACYILGTVGPCNSISEQSRYVIDQFLYVPKCSMESLELNAIDSALLCKVDHGGNCRNSVVIRNQNVLNHHLNMKNQKQRNYGK